jgi:succinate-semialdehyde dehydrogenase / glutarate-semialdehyde dehydrogenase
MQQSVNPFDQSLLAQLPLMNENDIRGKVVRADLTFRNWRDSSFGERARCMKRAGEVLSQNRDEYARLISLEMGKVLHEAKSEVQKCADACMFFADNAEEFLKDEVIHTEAIKSYVGYFPTGVILAVMPWNFPFWQVFRFAAPALMAGNVGLLKHSSNVPQCALAIEKVFLQAGFPEGAFQSLLIHNKDTELVLAHDAVQGVALTGSEKAGAVVASIAGKHIKKSVLELGGSDPFIVFPDADLGAAVKVAVQSRMQNAGQSCIAAKRFIVFDAIRNDFVGRFEEEIRKIKQGNQLEEGVSMGPMARVDLAEELEGQLRRTVKQGGRLIVGGDRSGASFKPALVDEVTPAMPAFQEETFGPLACVTYIRNDEEALRIANDNRYGLGASVWSKDTERAERIARRIESGTVYINALMRSDSRLPFGGIKKSGYGRELSAHGIREFVNVKTISVNM